MENSGVTTDNKAINVVTYNILSKLYGNKSTFPNNLEEHLDGEYRWLKISDQLKNWISKGSIICLQEVCDYFRELIINLCDESDYSYEYNKYGGKRSGNMGVMMLYPDNYQIVASFNKKLGQNSRDYRIKNAYNKALIIKFKIMSMNGSKKIYKYLTVGNYHMPCLYRYPNTQKEIFKYYLGKVRNIASYNGKLYPFILTGDFNMSDVSDKFANILINNNMTLPVSYIPPSNSYIPIVNNITTNVFNNNKYFAGILDYIIISNDLSFVSYDVLYNLPDENDNCPINPNNNLTLLPDKNNPSDHLPVFAVIDI